MLLYILVSYYLLVYKNYLSKWTCIKLNSLLNLISSLGGTSIKSKLKVLAFVFLDLLGAFGTSLLILTGSSSSCGFSTCF